MTPPIRYTTLAAEDAHRILARPGAEDTLVVVVRANGEPAYLAVHPRWHDSVRALLAGEPVPPRPVRILDVAARPSSPTIPPLPPRELEPEDIA